MDHMRLFVPGKERVASGEDITYHMVFKDDHALQLERAGFTQVHVDSLSRSRLAQVPLVLNLFDVK
jgi:hypothetical protein